MCGIAGWIDHSQDMSERIDLLNRMSETLDRRGPDENGLYINRGDYDKNGIRKWGVRTGDIPAHMVFLYK